MEIINVQMTAPFGEINQTRRENIMNNLDNVVKNNEQIFNISQNVPIDVNFDLDRISATVSFKSLESIPNYTSAIKILIESVSKTLMLDSFNSLSFMYTNKKTVETNIRESLLSLMEIDTSYYRGLGLKAALNKNGIHADLFFEPSYQPNIDNDNPYELYYQFSGGFDDYRHGDLSVINNLEGLITKFVTTAKEEMDLVERNFRNRSGERNEGQGNN